MPLPGMIVYATPSSPSQPSEKEPNSGAAEGAETIGYFAQLLFMILALQSAVINQSPASSEGEIAGVVSAASASPREPRSRGNFESPSFRITHEPARYGS